MHTFESNRPTETVQRRLRTIGRSAIMLLGLLALGLLLAACGTGSFEIVAEPDVRVTALEATGPAPRALLSPAVLRNAKTWLSSVSTRSKSPRRKASLDFRFSISSR